MRSLRDETKFHRMIGFAKRLPHIRQRTARDLRLDLARAADRFFGDLERRALSGDWLEAMLSGLDRRSSHYRTALTLVALIHRALAKYPEQRPADANEMRLSLLGATPAPSGTQLLPDTPTEPAAPPPPIGATGPQRRPPRQPKSLRLLWTVVFGVVIAVLGIALAQRLGDTSTPTDEPTVRQQAPANADAGEQAPEAGAEQAPEAGGEQAPDAGDDQQQEGVAPPAPDAAATPEADAAPQEEPAPAPEPEPTG